MLSLKNFPLILVFILVVIVSLYNFQRSIPFQLLDFDSFQYLTFSRSVFSGGELFISPIRSPITAVLFFGDILVSRFFMVLFHIGTAVLVYILSMKLFKDRFIAVFALLVYGLSWWMLVFQTSPLTDLPGMFLFLLGLVFWLQKDKRSILISGVIFGLASLVRFDLVFFVLPLLFFTKRDRWIHFLAPFLGVTIFFEFALDVFVYKQLVYAPFEFFKVNFLKFGGVGSKDFFHVAKTLLSLFPILSLLSIFSLFAFKKYGNKVLLSVALPFFLFVSYAQPEEPRIFVVKFLPILALLSASFFGILQQWFGDEGLKRFFRFGVLFLLVTVSIFQIWSIQYDEREFEAKDCVSGRVCSNFHSAVEYYCGVRTELVKPTLTSVGNIGDSCGYLVYFKDISLYNEDVNTYLLENFQLHGENSAAYIFQLK